MTVIVITSDWHPDKHTAGFARFEDVRAAVEQSVDVAIAEDADAYVFCGDLCDPDSPDALRSIALAAWLAQTLSIRGIDVFFLAGNHDIVEDGRGTTSLTPLRHGPGFVFEKPGVATIVGGRHLGALRALFLPYPSASDPYDVRAVVEGADKNVDLVFSHLMLEGIAVGSETKDMPRGRDVFLPIELIQKRWPAATIYNGHYHEPSVWRGVHVIGSLARLTRGEIANNPRIIVHRADPTFQGPDGADQAAAD